MFDLKRFTFNVVRRFYDKSLWVFSTDFKPFWTHKKNPLHKIVPYTNGVIIDLGIYAIGNRNCIARSVRNSSIFITFWCDCFSKYEGELCLRLFYCHLLLPIKYQKFYSTSTNFDNATRNWWVNLNLNKIKTRKLIKWFRKCKTTRERDDPGLLCYVWKYLHSGKAFLVIWFTVVHYMQIADSP